MPLITQSYRTALAAPASVDATAIRVAPNQPDLCETVTTGSKHVVLTIFNAKYSELVLATGCELIEGIKHVTVQRGFGGTTARAWELDTCVCTASIMDACVTTTSSSAYCPKPLAAVKTEGCIEIVGSDTCTPTIRLRTTGVTPVANACIRVNECGLVEWVSPNFPWDCMPVYEPCSPCASCGGTSSSGATSATNVSYNGGGNEFAVGPDVGSALTQLDIAVQSLASNQGIMSLAPGDGIDISGSVANPTISLVPVITPDDYNGFTVNRFGQITAFDPAGLPQHIPQAPISINYNPATNEYTHSVATASETARGVVQLVSSSDVQNDTVPASADLFAVSWRALVEFFTSRMPELNTGNGIAGSAGVFNTARTLVLNFLGLTATTTLADSAYIPYTSATGDHFRVGVPDASREFGGAYARALVNMPSAAIVAAKGVSAVTRTAAGEYTFTMAISGTLPSIYIVHAVAVNYNTPHYFTYQPLSATQFELRCYNTGGVQVDPGQIAVTVVAAG